MNYLVDTNILIRVALRSHPQSRALRLAIKRLSAPNNELFVSSQNLVESWSVVTRPVAANGFGLTPRQASDRLGVPERMFSVLPESDKIYERWRQLVARYQTIGMKSFDARLVATMLENSISHILTYNLTDFARYAAEGVVAVSPDSV